MRCEHDIEDGVALTVGMRRGADIIVRSQAAMIDVVHNFCYLRAATVIVGTSDVRDPEQNSRMSSRTPESGPDKRTIVGRG